MKAYAICPFCGLRINLKQRKDFESFSMVEVQRHFEKEHPEELAKYDFGMPFTPVEFDAP